MQLAAHYSGRVQVNKLLECNDYCFGVGLVLQVAVSKPELEKRTDSRSYFWRRINCPLKHTNRWPTPAHVPECPTNPIVQRWPSGICTSFRNQPASRTESPEGLGKGPAKVFGKAPAPVPIYPHWSRVIIVCYCIGCP